MTTTKYSVPAILAILVIASGCNAKNTTAGAGGSGSTTATGQSSSTGPDPHYACVESGFMAGPLQGPGYDQTMGGFIGTPQSSYVVSSTQIYTDPSQDAAFYKAFGPVAASLGANPDGLVAYSLGQDANCHMYRTLAVWESQDKMMTWVGGGAHATAAAKFSSVSVTGKVTFWTATADDVKALTWDVARTHLDQVQPLAY